MFAYPRWNKVLADLGLKPDVTNYEVENEAAARYRGGGDE